MILKIAQLLRSMHREDKGFTLVELLVVIAILGVLAAIAIPVIATRIDSAREAANEANIRQLQGAADLYKLDVGDYPSGAVNFQDQLLDTEEPEPVGSTDWDGPYLREHVDPPTGYNPYTIDEGDGKVRNQTDAEAGEGG